MDPIIEEKQLYQSPTDGSTLCELATSPTSEDFVTEVKPNARISVNLRSSTSSEHESPPAGSQAPTSSTLSRWIRATPLGRHLADSYGRELGLERERDQAPPWSTRLIRFGPLSGIISMFLAIGMIVSSLGILAGSNGQAASWTVPPSTWIAAFTAIANLAVRYAALQGVIIAWWAKAAQGSTLSRLHYDWKAGTTLRGAVTSGRHMGLLGLACIFSFLVVIDGPFLQRATTIKPAAYSNPVHLNISMAEELPHDLSGVWGTNHDYFSSWMGALYTFNYTVPTSDPNKRISNAIIPTQSTFLGTSVSALWYYDKPLPGVVQGCPEGGCKTTLRAPALAATSCRSYPLPVNYRTPYNWTALQSQPHWLVPPLGSMAFVTGTNLVIEDDEESINLITGYGTTHDCKGIFNYTACTFKSAIGEYNVTIGPEGLTVENPASPKIIALANNTMPNHTWSHARTGYPSTLGGIAGLAIATWDANAWIQTESNGHLKPWIQGGTSVQSYQIDDGDFLCPSFRDPREFIVAGLNKLMFYAGGMLASKYDASYLEDRMDDGLTVQKTVEGYLEGNHNVFDTNYSYFAAAAVIELVCIVLIAPTYWGWWNLGRQVSFSPLEVAKAFQSPLLEHCNSNSTGRELARDVAEVGIQYGVTRDPSMRSKLAFGDPLHVSQPERGMRFDV